MIWFRVSFVVSVDEPNTTIVSITGQRGVVEQNLLSLFQQNQFMLVST